MSLPHSTHVHELHVVGESGAVSRLYSNSIAPGDTILSGYSY